MFASRSWSTIAHALLIAVLSLTEVIAFTQAHKPSIVAWEFLAPHEAPNHEHVRARGLSDLAVIGNYVRLHSVEIFQQLNLMRDANEAVVFGFPMPDTNITIVCNLTESNMTLPTALRIKYPSIHHWRGPCTGSLRLDLIGEDDVQDSLAMTFTNTSSSESIYVDSAVDSSDVYLMYNNLKAHSSSSGGFSCGDPDNATATVINKDFALSEQAAISAARTVVVDLSSSTNTTSSSNSTIATRSTSSVSTTKGRELKIALIANKQYSAVHNNNTASVLVAMTQVMARVNGIYMREMGVYFQMIDDNDILICAGEQIDDACNALSNTWTVYTQNNNFIVNERGIKLKNFDVGHSFTTNSGGIASIGSICDTDRAQGTTGLSNPVGDRFAVDYVAHELGHQLGMGHNFRDCPGSQSSRVSAQAVEPGSGATIMSYAGICGTANLQSQVMPLFGSTSMEKARALLTKRSSCGTVKTTSRTSPVVSVTSSCSVPVGQYFVLEGESLTSTNSSVYTWSRSDAGFETYSDKSNGRFRPWEPTKSKLRYFPNLYYTLNSVSTLQELLPSAATTMKMRFHERAMYDETALLGDDEEDSIGDYGFAETTVKFVSGTPMNITNSETEFDQGGEYTISWNSGSTSSLSSTIGIYMALDTLPLAEVTSFDYGDDIVDPEWVLVDTVENSGSADVLIPTTIHSSKSSQNGLLMIKSTGDSGCAFFDIKRISIGAVVSVTTTSSDSGAKNSTISSTSTPAPTSAPCYEQGIREVVKKSNKISLITKIDAAQDCANECLDVSKCQFFTYKSKGKKCWLLSSSIRSKKNVGKKWYSGEKANCENSSL